MAAIFYSPLIGPQVFQGGLTINTSVRVPFLSNLVGPGGFSIINAVTVQNGDTIQYFLTFDDFISYFYFGKGLGNMSIEGTMFMTCNGYSPGIDVFYNQISRFRGQAVDVSFGSAVFTGVISTFTTTAVAEPAGTIDFTVQLSIIDHSLAAPVFDPIC